MAKLGEGDARWIVDDRKDGTNVNQWHWQETDCLEWSKQKLKACFVGKELVVLDQGKSVVLESVDVTGEAYINTRKGKLIAGYELKVQIPFKTKSNSSEDGSQVEGKVEFPYIGDENKDEDAEVTVVMGATDNSERRKLADRVKQMLLSKHKSWLVSEMNAFVKMLSAGGPALEKGSAKTASSEQKKSNEGQAPPPKAAKPKPKPAAAKTSGKSIELREEFYCRPSDLFECYMDPNRVRAYTGSDAKIVPKVGESFSLFNGSIEGKQIEIVQNERIVQDWRSSSWPAGVFSRVVITFSSPSEGKTIMQLKQTGIPEEDNYGNSNTVDNTYQGWRMQIWGRIRQCFGFGC